MSALDVLLAIGPAAITVLEAFPVWGPVLAVAVVLLVVSAVQDTRKDTGDTVSSRVPATEDTVPGASPDEPEGGL